MDQVVIPETQYRVQVVKAFLKAEKIKETLYSSSSSSGTYYTSLAGIQSMRLDK